MGTYIVNFRGLPACPCLAAWLPVYERELQDLGILGPGVQLHIYQLIGGAAASGGTHAEGGAADLLNLPGNVDVEVARQMGADACWSRPKGWDGKNGIEHNHLVLTGCPHNGPAAYQITAVRAGFNGLGSGGRGAADPGPRPLSGRTWREGVAWAQARQAARVAKAKAEAAPKKTTRADALAVRKHLTELIQNAEPGTRLRAKLVAARAALPSPDEK